MKVKLLVIPFLILYIIACSQQLFITTHAVEPKMVFAAYMQGMPTYGNTVEAFKKEIKEAQSLGIDGFVYYVQSWNMGANPKIYTAADESGFKMMIGLDLMCLRNSDNDSTCASLIVDQIKTAVQHTSYYRYNGRPVVLTWQGRDQNFKDTSFWKNNVLDPLKQNGIDVLLMPFFSIQKRNVPIENWSWPNWFFDLADGFNHVGASRAPQDSIYYGEAEAAYMRQLNKFFMGGVSPYYFRTRKSAPLRDYIEYHGGEGIADQWNSIIGTQKPRWVLIFTWNDYTESYISPVDTSDPNILPIWRNTCPAFCQQTLPLLKPHAGYAQLMKYFIQWYKTGTQPAIAKDALYYFYRTHPKNMVATGEPNDIRTPNGTEDEIYITTMLTAPATLTVSTGNSVKTKQLASGIQHARIPFKPGNQVFKLYRNNNLVLEKAGEPILSSAALYNFVPTTGYAFSDAPNNPTPTPTPSGFISGDIINTGDTPGDEVNIFDYNLLVSDFGKTGSTGFVPADIDKNGKVDIFDYNIVVGNFGK